MQKICAFLKRHAPRFVSPRPSPTQSERRIPTGDGVTVITFSSSREPIRISLLFFYAFGDSRFIMLN